MEDFRKTDGPGRIVTVAVFETLAEAQWARNLLASSGICSLLPDEETNRIYNFFQGPAIDGVRLQVRDSDEQEAKAIIDALPYEKSPSAVRDRAAPRPRCLRCGSEDLAAVSPEESRLGPFEFRCLGCDQRIPVDEAIYRSDDYPILPVRCPSCGSFSLYGTEPPRGALSEAERCLDPEMFTRQWLRCGTCAHEWEAPVVPKGIPRDPSATDAEPGVRAAGGDRLRCPGCGSERIAQDISAAVEAGELFLYCEDCRNQWTEPPCERGGDSPAGASAIDASEVCPIPRGTACPACGAPGCRPCPPPDCAGESRLLSALKRLVGGGWYRCLRCGHTWERGEAW